MGSPNGPRDRVVLLGSRATVACRGLKVLSDLGLSVPLVISGEEDTGEDDWRLSLIKTARAMGYREGESLLRVRAPHEPHVLERIRAARPDVILSLQWRRILRQPVLGIGGCRVLNLHNAPLPLLRGCDPFPWAINDGLQNMGVTLHEVTNEGVDDGPILVQRLWPVTRFTTAWQLYQEALDQAELLMRETFRDVIDGKVQARAQDDRYATYHPRGQFRFQDLEANWNLPAVALSAELRARVFPPFQLPFFRFRGKPVEILSCCAVSARGKPGTLLSADPLTIGAKAGALEIARIRLDGSEQDPRMFAKTAGLSVGHSVA